MNSVNLIGWFGSALVVTGMSAGVVQADTVYADDFNRNALNGGTYTYVANHGVVQGNRLTFTDATLGGDTFTAGTAFAVEVGQLYELSFDYDGAANGNGFIGFSRDFPGSHQWIAGTQTNYLDNGALVSVVPESQPSRKLLDGVGENRYAIRFTSNVNSLRVMFEDFALSQSDATAPNAFFDNVRVAAVPAPLAVWGGLGLMSVFGATKLRRQAAQI